MHAQTGTDGGEGGGNRMKTALKNALRSLRAGADKILTNVVAGLTPSGGGRGTYGRRRLRRQQLIMKVTTTSMTTAMTTLTSRGGAGQSHDYNEGNRGHYVKDVWGKLIVSTVDLLA